MHCLQIKKIIESHEKSIENFAINLGILFNGYVLIYDFLA